MCHVTAEGRGGRAEEDDGVVARAGGGGLEERARRVVRTTGVAGARVMTLGVAKIAPSKTIPVLRSCVSIHSRASSPLLM